jgi:hypothetical protein
MTAQQQKINSMIPDRQNLPLNDRAELAGCSFISVYDRKHCGTSHEVKQVARSITSEPRAEQGC